MDRGCHSGVHMAHRLLRMSTDFRPPGAASDGEPWPNLPVQIGKTRLPQPPIHGIPVAVKDNIDVAGLPTTAGCPAFSYLPSHDATCVARLRAAGAILIGKTNLDQFATGLVGVRSPYGIPKNPMRGDLIPGGSGSGAAGV